ncbi:MAG: hypothetical protein C3F14_09485 [Deltaproteobacteria bacterium]|nr:MAG: hypothetical protein C3F14_09485 [Deltaproteobacteria bacterium]
MPVYICYVNKSGTLQCFGDASHFVLAGIAIPAVQWKELESKIIKIKKRFELADTEIDTAWMMRRCADPGNVETDEKTEGYSNLTQEERQGFLARICEEINTWTEARLFAEAYDWNALSDCPLTPSRMYEFAFHHVISRFQAFLVNRGNYLGSPLYGLVVQANQEENSARVTNIMRNFHRRGPPWTKFDKIVETPLLVDIRSTSMVQIADVCSYAVQRFFEFGETDLFDRIYSKFDRAKDTVVGIRHYTAHKCCQCRVCVDHHVPSVKMGAGAPMVARYDRVPRYGPEKDPCRR